MNVDGRGGLDAFEPDESNKVQEGRDCIIAFGCPPNSYTPADSTLTVECWNELNKNSDSRAKLVFSPGNMTAWTPCT